MKQVSKLNSRQSEQGNAKVKLLIAAVIISLTAYAGYNYIPTAYNAQSFKQDMDTAVIQGISMPTKVGKPADIVRAKLTKEVENHQLPYDTFIDVKQNGNIVTARVYYKKDVPILPFGIFNYEYVFDYSASPNGFLTD